jgi:prolyl 4-hydroxylase
MFESPRQGVYGAYMDGCYEEYDADECDAEEEIRLAMNHRQPQSMVNLTSTGYHKVRAPDALMKLLTDFWETNMDSLVEEEWSEGNIYTVSGSFALVVVSLVMKNRLLCSRE